MGANFSQSRTRIFKNFSPVKTIVVPLGETNIGKLLTTVFILISPLPSHPPPAPPSTRPLFESYFVSVALVLGLQPDEKGFQ